jgi:ribulose-phosphate 3-epimerase
MRNIIDLIPRDRITVSPSVLAADFAALGQEVDKVTEAGCDLLHLDVMDGHFVPNLTMGPPLLKSLRSRSNLIFDTHLMLSDPLKYAKDFIDAGADHITFHLESNNNPDEVIKMLRKLGCTVGISLKPATSAAAVIPYLNKIDLVLVMTVEPGFGGQSFMAEMMPKVKTIHEAIKAAKLPVHLELDGGIDAKTVEVAAKAGANMMVAGTSVFRNPAGAKVAIAELHAATQWL